MIGGVIIGTLVSINGGRSVTDRNVGKVVENYLRTKPARDAFAKGCGGCKSAALPQAAGGEQMAALILMIQFMTRYPLPGEVPFTAENFVCGMK